MKDIALARSFNFDNWRKRFNGWVDQQKLRVNDLFRRFDGNHDGMLTREEFMKALKASGESKTSLAHFIEYIDSESFSHERSPQSPSHMITEVDFKYPWLRSQHPPIFLYCRCSYIATL